MKAINTSVYIQKPDHVQKVWRPAKHTIEHKISHCRFLQGVNRGLKLENVSIKIKADANKFKTGN